MAASTCSAVPGSRLPVGSSMSTQAGSFTNARQALPWLYWNAMLKGREWLVKPEHRS